jgi:hypothetical protein
VAGGPGKAQAQGARVAIARVSHIRSHKRPHRLTVQFHLCHASALPSRSSPWLGFSRLLISRDTGKWGSYGAPVSQRPRTSWCWVTRPVLRGESPEIRHGGISCPRAGWGPLEGKTLAPWGNSGGAPAC